MMIEINYHDLIAYAMLGQGKMETTKIYKRVEAIAKRKGWPLSKHWRSTVRNTLQRHCRGNSKFISPYLFINHDRGVWECRI